MKENKQVQCKKCKTFVVGTIENARMLIASLCGVFWLIVAFCALPFSKVFSTFFVLMAMAAFIYAAIKGCSKINHYVCSKCHYKFEVKK